MKGRANKKLKCPYISCDYAETFSRQWELKRHCISKHKDEKAFSCPVVGWIKDNRAPAFARPDKLTDHIRAAHRDRSATAVCPELTCTTTGLGLDLLGVHIKLKHLSNNEGGAVEKALCAIVNAASMDQRRYPLSSCKRKQTCLEDFSFHLLSHTSEELDVVTTELAQEGYIVGKFECEHEEGVGATSGWCVCGMSSIQVACPVCQSCHWDKQGLKAHIEESHIQAGEVVTSFRQQILALIGTEAIQMLGEEAWIDVAP